ncbi:MAG TPA: M23 family metallopeptidase [Gaiellaceae bacterium]
MSVRRILLLVSVVLLASYQAVALHDGGSTAALAGTQAARTCGAASEEYTGPFDAPYGVKAILSKQRPDRRAYGWPVKPFDRQHVVRAYLNDPRIYRTDRSFHFGIDISVPPGTAVYAVEPGRAYKANRWAVSVRGNGRSFAYWHIVPVVGGGRWVGRHALLGHTRSMFNHVHFAEFRAGRYLNPLRTGGIGPFRDRTAPIVERLTFREHPRLWLEPAHVRGTVDLVADACDIAPGVEREPWPVAPALVRWRIFRGDALVAGWRTAVDLAPRQLAMKRFGLIYAYGTRQNKPGRPGEYCFYLAHRWSSKSLRNGFYRIEVAAADVHGNVGIGNFAFQIVN